MTLQVFSNQEQFEQASIVLVSRFVFDVAAGVISQGNIADDSEHFLSYLFNLAKQKKVDKKSLDVIAFYLAQVSDENQEKKVKKSA